MAAGLGLLRLPPSSFWSMTPAELAAALRSVHGRPAAAAVPSRRELSRLMKQFPDREDTTDG